MMSPLLKPMVIISTKITMMMDSTKLMAKVPNESSTRLG